MNRLNRLSSPHLGMGVDENNRVILSAPMIAPLIVIAVRCPQRWVRPHGDRERVWDVGPEYWNGYKEEEE